MLTPKLPNPVKDAREVATTLKKMGWKVDVLENPEGKLFRRKLHQLIVGPGRDKDKAILLWFSGHGYTFKEADGLSLGYLVPIDAPDPEKDEIGFMEKAVSMRYIETVAKRIQAKHVLMAFDSCFSGAIFQMVRARPSAYIQEKVAEPVRQLITAGNETEQVPDRSVFKDVFIQGIHKGYADRNNDGYVTGEELGSYLQEKVVNYSRKAQHPQFGKINNPKLDKGDFIFHLASSGLVIEKTSPSPSKSYLSVESNVSGARVLIDGRYVGTTTLSDVKVKAGEHRIRVEKDGYESYTKRIGFEKGRSRDLYVILDREEPLKGRLYVDRQPEAATIKILNIGPAFYQGIELDEGRYQVEIAADGYETQKMWVSLSAGQDKTLDIHLKPLSDKGRKISNSLGMEFVYIEPGTFMMGSPSNEPRRDNDERQHRVTLTKGFYMQTTEVTQGQWKAVMWNNPSYFKNCGDDCPVEQVSWNNVQQFINKLNQREGSDICRLPTEAEWEYSCRSGTDTPFSFGQCLSTDQANYNGNYPLPGCSKGKYRETTISVARFFAQ